MAKGESIQRRRLRPAHGRSAHRLRVAQLAQRGEAGGALSPARWPAGRRRSAGRRAADSADGSSASSWLRSARRRRTLAGCSELRMPAAAVSSRAVQHRQGVEFEFGIDARGPGHLDQMAEQAEAGQVGAGAWRRGRSGRRPRRGWTPASSRAPRRSSGRAPSSCACAANSVPVPIGLVRISTSPGRMPPLRITLARAARRSGR